MTVKITPNDRSNPPGKLADAELHFSEGPLEGLKLIGFSIWERRGGNGRNVTFPARSYAVNGERRTFALLRPISDSTGQEKLRQQARVFLGPFRRQRPFLAKALGELGLEERALHAAIDDVPWQPGVATA